MRPGETAALHWHPKHLSYFFQGGSLRLTNEAGESKVSVLADGQTSVGTELWHTVKNVGSTEIRALQIEFKK